MERKDWIDQLRGFAFFIVVLCHASVLGVISHVGAFDDNVNASNAPAVMPGLKTGSVISQNVRMRLAPRSILASSIEIS